MDKDRENRFIGDGVDVVVDDVGFFRGVVGAGGGIDGVVVGVVAIVVVERAAIGVVAGVVLAARSVVGVRVTIAPRLATVRMDWTGIGIGNAVVVVLILVVVVSIVVVSVIVVVPVLVVAVVVRRVL